MLSRDDIVKEFLEGGLPVSMDSPIVDLVCQYGVEVPDFMRLRASLRLVNEFYNTVSVYWVEGFSKRWDSAFGGFANYIFHRYYVPTSFSMFVEESKWRVEDRLLERRYNPFKSNFVSYIHKVFRNEASRIRRIGKNRITYFSAFMGDITVDRQVVMADINSQARFEESEKYSSFFALCRARGVQINEDVFVDKVNRGMISPIILAYRWHTGHAE